MKRRANAASATFNSLIGAVELLIAIGFVVRFFSKDGILDQLFSGMGSLVSKSSWNNSLYSSNTDISDPFTYLAIILSFMAFGYFMLVYFPKMVRKKEREFDIKDEY